MAQYPKILGLLGLGSEKEALTEAHMQAAEEKITQLEQGKADADLKAEQAAAALQTAQEEKTKIAGELETTKGTLATLEEWKKNQQAVDGREKDDSNTLDDNQAEALAPWEKTAAKAVASAKKRLGEK
jgi:hypothetical protein